jgi:hypothetical protein
MDLVVLRNAISYPNDLDLEILAHDFLPFFPICCCGTYMTPRNCEFHEVENHFFKMLVFSCQGPHAKPPLALCYPTELSLDRRSVL